MGVGVGADMGVGADVCQGLVEGAFGWEVSVVYADWDSLRGGVDISKVVGDDCGGRGWYGIV